MRNRTEDNPTTPAENIAQTAERLARGELQQGCVPNNHRDGVPYVLIPDGHSFHVLDEETFLELPTRHRGTLTVKSLPAFETVLKRFIDKDRTVIFHGDALAPWVQAVFDFSTKEQPLWEDHAVKFGFTPTAEWDAWKRRDNEMISQASFAQFIEDYSGNLVSLEDGADALDLVEAARAFKATRTLNFEREHREKDGTLHLLYSEETTATGRHQKVIIPDEFGVRVIPWVGSDPITLRARFRYHVENNGGMTMGFRFIRLDQTLQPMFDEAIARLTESYGLPMIYTAGR